MQDQFLGIAEVFDNEQAKPGFHTDPMDRRPTLSLRMGITRRVDRVSMTVFQAAAVS